MMMIFGALVLQAFFFFFEIFIIQAVMEVKLQKIAQNDKKQLHPSRAISQDLYFHFWGY